LKPKDFTGPQVLPESSEMAWAGEVGQNLYEEIDLIARK
jgi:hypothetical protein